jgi:hypothetical protein
MKARCSWNITIEGKDAADVDLVKLITSLSEQEKVEVKITSAGNHVTYMTDGNNTKLDVEKS